MTPPHDRMPGPVPLGASVTRLNPATPVGRLQDLLRPYPADEMTENAVGPAVNNARNEGPECLEPAA